MDRDINFLLSYGMARTFALQHLTTGITNTSVVENNGKTYLRCTLTTGGHVDLELKNLLTDDKYNWVTQHYDKLTYNTTTGNLEYDGVPIGASITEDIKATVACGAVKVGDVIPTGMSLTEFAKKLLLQELAPKVTITSTDPYANTYYERGIAINPTLTIKVEKVNPTDADIKNITLTSTPTDSTFDMVDNTPNVSSNTITKVVTMSDTTSFTVKGTNVIDKVGSKTATFTFVDPIYYGSLPQTLDVTTVTETDVLGGIKELLLVDTTNGNLTNKMSKTMTVSMEKIYIAYPKSYGALKSIKDVANGFELLTGFEQCEIDVTTVDGTVVTYYCYMGVVRSNVTDFATNFVW